MITITQTPIVMNSHSTHINKIYLSEDLSALSGNVYCLNIQTATINIDVEELFFNPEVTSTLSSLGITIGENSTILDIKSKNVFIYKDTLEKVKNYQVKLQLTGRLANSIRNRRYDVSDSGIMSFKGSLVEASNTKIAPAGANLKILVQSLQLDKRHSLTELLTMTGAKGDIISFEPSLEGAPIPNERRYVIYLNEGVY